MKPPCKGCPRESLSKNKGRCVACKKPALYDKYIKWKYDCADVRSDLNFTGIENYEIKIT